jgi:hypothetical protein
MSQAGISDRLTLALQFIKSKRHLGLELVEMDGRPTVHADPSMVPSEAGRWQAMVEAVEQLVACSTELNYLVRRGKLHLPKHPGYGR